MIIPMKRCFILLQECHVKNCLERIQQLGVLHISQQRYETENIAKLQHKLKDIEAILNRLKLFNSKTRLPKRIEL